jgi:hypothetical protein
MALLAMTHFRTFQSNDPPIFGLREAIDERSRAGPLAPIP